MAQFHRWNLESIQFSLRQINGRRAWTLAVIGLEKIEFVEGFPLLWDFGHSSIFQCFFESQSELGDTLRFGDIVLVLWPQPCALSLSQ